MRIVRRNGYRVIEGGPVPPQAAAITLGKTVVVRQRFAADDALMAHELVHVRQFASLGPLRFGIRYVASYLRGRLAGYGHMAAYRRIPLEVEASWLSRLHDVDALEPGTAAQPQLRADVAGQAVPLTVGAVTAPTPGRVRRQQRRRRAVRSLTKNPS